jgi:hypothetical protein
MLMGRVTLFLTCQSFLVAAYAVSCTRLGQPNWFSNRALPVLAVMISFLAYFMIEGAANAMDQWNGLRRSLVGSFAQEWLVVATLDSVCVYGGLASDLHRVADASLDPARIMSLVVMPMATGSLCRLRRGGQPTPRGRRR